MAFELVYTSVPRGVRPGSSGFCIVAYTNGLAGNLILQLESLSAYKPYFPHYDENAYRNPVAYSHYILKSSGETLHILSRTCFCGLDYTKRSNKLAHHIVARHNEIPGIISGPAQVFKQPGLYFSEWTGEPQLFQQQKLLEDSNTPLRTAACWEKYSGDAGWAGELAQSFLDSPDRPAFVIYDPLVHENILDLVEEALLLLPVEKRWEVSFNTYFTTLPAGMKCAWRFCVPDSDALRESRRIPGALVIDLTKPVCKASDGVLQEVARTGIAPVVEEKPVEIAPTNDSKLRVKEVPKAEAPVRQIPQKEIPKKRKNIALQLTLVVMGIAIIVLAGMVLYQHLQKMGPPPPTSLGESPNEISGKMVEPAKTVSTPKEELGEVVKEKEKPVVAETGEALTKISTESVKESGTAMVPINNKGQGEQQVNREAEDKLNNEKKLEMERKLDEAAAMFWKQDFSGLQKTGGEWSLDILKEGETVKGLKINDKVVNKSGSIVEEIFDPMGTGNGKRIYQYKVEENGAALKISTVQNNPAYKIDGIITNQRTLQMKFVPGVSWILLKGTSEGEIELRHSKEKGIQVSYKLTDNDKIALKDMELKNLALEIDLKDELVSSDNLSIASGDEASHAKLKSPVARAYEARRKALVAGEKRSAQLKELWKKIENEEIKKAIQEYFKEDLRLYNNLNARLKAAKGSAANDQDAKKEEAELSEKLGKLKDKMGNVDSIRATQNDWKAVDKVPVMYLREIPQVADWKAPASIDFSKSWAELNAENDLPKLQKEYEDEANKLIVQLREGKGYLMLEKSRIKQIEKIEGWK